VKLFKIFNFNLAKPKFGAVDFAGTIFVRDVVDDDYIGFIFRYDSNELV